MSVEAMAWAFAQPLPPCPKSVLVALANRADEDGQCWPGLEDLEQRTGWNRRSIQRAVKDLQARGLLVASFRFKPLGGQNSNLYRLACSPDFTPARPQGDTQSPGRVTHGRGEGDTQSPRGVTPCHGEGDTQSPRGVTPCHGEGDTQSPKSSSEQSVEQSREVGGAAPVPPTAPACGVTATGSDSKTTGKPRGHRASVFPDGWEVEPWMIELCKGFGLNPHAEFRDFKNNHKAKGTLFVSWPHAFRTWVTRSVKFQQQRRG